MFPSISAGSISMAHTLAFRFSLAYGSSAGSVRRKRARGPVAVACCVSGEGRGQLEAELCLPSARARAGVGRRCAVPCRRPSVPSAARVVCERLLRERAAASPRGEAGGGVGGDGAAGILCATGSRDA